MNYMIFVCVLLCVSCKPDQQIDIQGHRGYRGLYPENTIPAFHKALDIGVHTLELDVVISKDHKVVVSHEPFMNHEVALDAFGKEIAEADEKAFNLYTMTYDSITLYDCGTKAHPRFPLQNKMSVHKPLLSDVITLAEKASNHTINYNIEIKSAPKDDAIYTPKVDTFVELVLSVINSEGIADRTTLQSFDLRALEVGHIKQPLLKTALLVDENESIDQKLKELTFKPNIISPYFELLSAHSVSEYQKRGFQIVPWTLNDSIDIDKMLDYEVDGIISDFPDRVMRQLQAK